jgi:hypothetical protein
MNPHQAMYFTKDYAGEKPRYTGHPVLAEDVDDEADELL